MTIAAMEKDGFEFSSDLATWDWADREAGWAHAWAQEDRLIQGEYGNPTHQTCHTVMKFGLNINRNQTVNSGDLLLSVERFRKQQVFEIKAVLDSDGFGIPSAGNLIGGQGVTLTTASVVIDTRTSPLAGSINPFDGTVDPFDNWYLDTNPAVIPIQSVIQEVVNNAAWPASGGGSIVLIFEHIDVAGVTAYAQFWSSEHPTETECQIDYDVDVSPTITDVSSDDIILSSDTSFTVNTTNFTLPLTNPRIYKGARSQALTISGTPTTTQHVTTYSQASLGYGSGYTYEVSQNGTPISLAVTLNPIATKSYVVIVTPSITDNSLCFNASPVVKAGDIFEFDTTSALGDTVSIDNAGIPQLSGAGTGVDTFECRYWSAETGIWGDAFTVEFRDLSYFNQNSIAPIVPVVTAHAFVQIASGEIDTPTATATMFPFEPIELTNDPNLGFASVNSPSLKIVDASKTLNLYAYRDNTGEFQFLESGSPIDLFKATKIELKIGNLTFSDTDGQWGSKFTKAAEGKLEVQLGELNLPPGQYKFYFILFSPTQPYGVVWNNKDQYVLNLVLA